MEISFLSRGCGGIIPRCFLVLALIFCQWISNQLVADNESSAALQEKGTLPHLNQHFSQIYTNPSRMTAAEVRNWIQGKDETQLENEIIPYVSRTFPRPMRVNTMRIYNVTAWNELRKIVTSDAPFTLCANGGSVTAGGGAGEGRYFRDVIRYLKESHTLPNSTNVTILDRGHGARSSLHSALVPQYYFPPDTIDILIWEFSINDAYGFDTEVDLEQRMAAERKAFETWLNAVSQLNPKRGRPPLVIVVYLWTSPFQLVNDTTHIDHVFESHQNIGAKYDFVVGYVNFGLYVEELRWGHNATKDLLIADKHHPNRLGHAMMGFLLMDFMQPDEERLNRAIESAPTLLRSVQNLRSNRICNHEGLNPARAISIKIQHSKVPLASWTMDSPRNTEINPGMLISESQTGSMLLGKQAENRRDRQRTRVLPCCHDKDTPMLEFALPNNAQLAEVEMVSLGMPRREEKRDIMVFLDDQDVTLQQRMVYEGPRLGENCLAWGMGNHNMYFPWFWVLLPEKQKNVTSIRLCSNQPDTCGDLREGLSIGSMSVY